MDVVHVQLIKFRYQLDLEGLSWPADLKKIKNSCNSQFTNLKFGMVVADINSLHIYGR